MVKTLPDKKGLIAEILAAQKTMEYERYVVGKTFTFDIGGGKFVIQGHTEALKTFLKNVRSEPINLPKAHTHNEIALRHGFAKCQNNGCYRPTKKESKEERS